MKTIILNIQYDGSGFAGYELQPGKRTVRGELEKALHQLFNKKTPLSAVSRTDAGVHALQQVVFFSGKTKVPLQKLPLALNALLPEDLCVIKAEVGTRKKVKAKTYEYLIFNDPFLAPQFRHFVWQVKPKLNIAAMRKAAKCLVGKHDFRSFCASGGADHDYKKKIHSIDICDLSFVIWGSERTKLIRIIISGKGFLYKMVRNIVGTLVEVGLGRIKPKEVRKILQAQDRKRAGRTAPAQGLCLTRVMV
jgi:tRNA pseudouridine38-40 synthase